MANCKKITFFFVSHDDWVNVPQSSYFPRMIPLGFFGWAEQTADRPKFETRKRFGNHRTSRILMVKLWCPVLLRVQPLIVWRIKHQQPGISQTYTAFLLFLTILMCYNQLNSHITPAQPQLFSQFSIFISSKNRAENTTNWSQRRATWHKSRHWDLEPRLRGPRWLKPGIELPEISQRKFGGLIGEFMVGWLCFYTLRMSRYEYMIIYIYNICLYLYASYLYIWYMHIVYVSICAAYICKYYWRVGVTRSCNSSDHVHMSKWSTHVNSL